MVSSVNTNVSFAYYNIDTRMPPLITSKPFVNYTYWAFTNILVKPSTTSTNNNSGSGSPCCKPLDLWKCPLGELLNNTKKWAKEIYILIHTFRLIPKLVLINI